MYETAVPHPSRVGPLDHALQCGAHAMAARADDATIVAALFHDIGHLLITDPSATTEARQDHDVVGARFLARWFPDDVTYPVRLHVAASRYLTTIEPTAFHRNGSSDDAETVAPVPMTTSEVLAFQENPHWMVALDLRRWDEASRVTGAPTPTMTVFREIVVDVLRSGRAG